MQILSAKDMTADDRARVAHKTMQNVHTLVKQEFVKGHVPEAEFNEMNQTVEDFSTRYLSADVGDVQEFNQRIREMRHAALDMAEVAALDDLDLANEILVQSIIDASIVEHGKHETRAFDSREIVMDFYAQDLGDKGEALALKYDRMALGMDDAHQRGVDYASLAD